MVWIMLGSGMDIKNRQYQALFLAVLVAAGSTAMAQSIGNQPSAPQAGKIFKSVDSSGNVVFSDKPGDNPNTVVVTPSPINVSDPGPAKVTTDKVATQQSQSPGAPAAATAVGAATDGALASGTNIDAKVDSNGNPIGDPNVSTQNEEEEEEAVAIELVSILSPLPDATLIDIPEPLYVGFQTSPVSLEGSGLMAEVYLDGKLAASGTSALLPVKVPDRGTHTLLVKVVDKNGQTQVSSKEQNIHIKKTAVARGN